MNQQFSMRLSDAGSRQKLPVLLVQAVLFLVAKKELQAFDKFDKATHINWGPESH